ncbi:hypothetical protein DERP_007852, partial [Dermatophagoides pteronyssinus]
GFFESDIQICSFGDCSPSFRSSTLPSSKSLVTGSAIIIFGDSFSLLSLLLLLTKTNIVTSDLENASRCACCAAIISNSNNADKRQYCPVKPKAKRKHLLNSNIFNGKNNKSSKR